MLCKTALAGLLLLLDLLVEHSFFNNRIKFFKLQFFFILSTFAVFLSLCPINMFGLGRLQLNKCIL